MPPRPAIKSVSDDSSIVRKFLYAANDRFVNCHSSHFHALFSPPGVKSLFAPSSSVFVGGEKVSERRRKGLDPSEINFFIEKRLILLDFVPFSLALSPLFLIVARNITLLIALSSLQPETGSVSLSIGKKEEKWQKFPTRL